MQSMRVPVPQFDAKMLTVSAFAKAREMSRQRVHQLIQEGRIKARWYKIETGQRIYLIYEKEEIQPRKPKVKNGR